MTDPANPRDAMTSDAGGWQPFLGLKVVDFSLQLPGPCATVILADLGAEVIRVEPPAGDPLRRVPVPMFRMSNRNKRSIVLDLKHTDARGVADRLVAGADFVIEGFRPGVARRLGIDYERLARINPRLIYCSLSGYGQSGPWRDAPGHELNYLAAAGSFCLPGHWGEPARRLGIPYADLAGSHHAVIAMLAALHERHTTGKGAHLDLSLFETALAATALRTGHELDGEQRAHLWPTNDLFESADGELLVLALVEEHFWRNFAAAVAHLAPDLSGPDYADDASRRRNGDALHARLHQVMQMLNADEWLRLFESRDVPIQRLSTPAQASSSAHVAEREMLMSLAGERHIPFPIRVNGKRGARLSSLAPVAGADAATILAELGYTMDSIAALRAGGALGPARP